jgi:hypothetical protein
MSLESELTQIREILQAELRTIAIAVERLANQQASAPAPAPAPAPEPNVVPIKEPVPEPEPTPEPPPAAAEASDEDLDQEDVSKLVQQHFKRFGGPKTAELLARYAGAKRVPDIPQKLYPAIAAEIQGKLAGEAA